MGNEVVLGMSVRRLNPDSNTSAFNTLKTSEEELASYE
jgi:hypothetical protein